MDRVRRLGNQWSGEQTRSYLTLFLIRYPTFQKLRKTMVAEENELSIVI